MAKEEHQESRLESYYHENELDHLLGYKGIYILDKEHKKSSNEKTM